MITEFQAIWLTTIGIAVTILLMSVEYIFFISRKNLSEETFFSWQILSLNPGWLYSGWRLKFFNYICKGTNFKILMYVRCFLAGILLMNQAQSNILYLIVLFFLFFCSLVVNTRHWHGRDGADEVLNVMLFGILSYYLINRTDTLHSAGLIFIISQLTLSYFISGYYKLISPVWRSGEAIKKIICTEYYGKPSLAHLINRRLAKIVCWITILWEVTFPLVWICPFPYSLIWLGFGIVFHISTAIIMGLNTFMLSFLSAYPLLFYFLSLNK
jgi:hypothetical protein